MIPIHGAFSRITPDMPVGLRQATGAKGIFGAYFTEEIRVMLNSALLRRPRIMTLTVTAIALWLILPFAFQFGSPNSQAQTTTATAGLFARLLAVPSGSPTTNALPIGSANYNTFMSAGSPQRVLHVEVNGVNMPAGTQLNVTLNNAVVGTMTLDPVRRGLLHLSTANGDTVPNVVVGDVLTVKNGDVAIVSGAFGPPPTPLPTVSPTLPPPSPLPTPSLRLIAQLAAPAASTTLVPRGLAEYTEFGAGPRLFEVFISNINLPNGTVLNVVVAGNPVGAITLFNHAGSLRLWSNSNTVFPVITVGTPMTIRNAGTIVLGGTFGAPPPPPSPTPTPTGSPTPPPAPLPARAFASKMNGHAVVPPVTTPGRGFGFVTLNPAATAINVRVAYTNLTAPATAITINGPAGPNATGPVIFTIANNGGTSGMTAPQSFDLTPQQVSQLRNGAWYIQIATGDTNTAVGYPDGEIRGQLRPVNRRDDFNGDGLSDISVVRPRVGFAPDNAANDWYTLSSGDNTFSVQSIGQPGDVNVQGDYDGDGISDIAMFTPSTGTWQIRRSGTGEITYSRFGTSGDIPVVGDYDGDSVNDLAVFRPSDGNWYVLRSSDDGYVVTRWGMAGDRPVAGDFDGDGINDLAIFRPSVGDWYIRRSSDNGMTAMHWGMIGDRGVAGDFDGDGTSDIAVYRPSSGTWYIYRSSDSQFSAYRWGAGGDIPVACEFDGDGMTDIAVFRPSTGQWYILRSSDNGMDVFQFGISTDRPIQTAYAPQ